MAQKKKQKFSSTNLACNRCFNILNILTPENALSIFLGTNHQRQPPPVPLEGTFLQQWNFTQDLSLTETQDQRGLLWIQLHLAKQAIANQIIMQSQVTAAECGEGIEVPRKHHVSDNQWDKAKDYWARCRHNQSKQ